MTNLPTQTGLATGPPADQERTVVETVAVTGELVEQPSEGRSYVILKEISAKSSNGNQTYEKVAVVKAGSNDQAVRQAAETPGLKFLNPSSPTHLVAVPERSFASITVEVETTTRVKLS